MGRTSRKIVAVNVESGKRKEFNRSIDCASFLGVGHANIRQAVERNGSCRGWRLYDAPEYIRKKIEILQGQLAEIEGEK